MLGKSVVGKRWTEKCYRERRCREVVVGEESCREGLERSAEERSVVGGSVVETRAVEKCL